MSFIDAYWIKKELDKLITEASAEVERLDTEAEDFDNCWESEEIEEHHQAIGRLAALGEARDIVTKLAPDA